MTYTSFNFFHKAVCYRKQTKSSLAWMVKDSAIPWRRVLQLLLSSGIAAATAASPFLSFKIAQRCFPDESQATNLARSSVWLISFETLALKHFCINKVELIITQVLPKGFYKIGIPIKQECKNIYNKSRNNKIYYWNNDKNNLKKARAINGKTE